MPEILVRVIGILLHGEAAGGADPAETLYSPQALYVGVGGGGEGGGGGGGGGGCGGSGGVRGSFGIMVFFGGRGCFVIMVFLGVEIENGGEFGPPAGAAAA